MEERSEESKVALFINFGTVKTLESIRRVYQKAKEFGKIIDAKIYFDQNEMELYKSLAVEASKMGIEPVVVLLAKDVKLAIDFLDAAYKNTVDYVIIVHHGEAIIPALRHSNSLRRTIIITPSKFRKLFENVVDKVIEI